MKAVILAGGFGTRLSEETETRPKPMIEIGNKPILWHIMKSYAHYGINEFVICCGYKGYLIKEYFANYFLHMTDVTISLHDNKLKFHDKRAESWTVTLIDTGLNSMTGGRLKKVKGYIDDNDCFCMTYGDGLGAVNIRDLIKFHKTKNTLATVTAVHQPGRFGTLNIFNEDKVKSFEEKPKKDGGRINGGFFVLSPKVLDLIDNDQTIWERGPLESLAKSGQLSAYLYDGFWQPMDTLRDKVRLEELWKENQAPWKVWET